MAQVDSLFAKMSADVRPRCDSRGYSNTSELAFHSGKSVATVIVPRLVGGSLGLHATRGNGPPQVRHCPWPGVGWFVKNTRLGTTMETVVDVGNTGRGYAACPSYGAAYPYPPFLGQSRIHRECEDRKHMHPVLVVCQVQASSESGLEPIAPY